MAICGFSQEKKDRLSQPNVNGAIEVMVFASYPGDAGEKYYSATVYNTGWNAVASLGGDGDRNRFTFVNLPSGNYYVWANASVAHGSGWEEECWKHLWAGTYYKDSPDKNAAVPVNVHPPDTTRISIDLIHPSSYIRLETSPLPFQITVDGSPYSSPKTFAWKQSDVHAIGVAESYKGPDGKNYSFKKWRHGGSRTQNYAVPAGTFRHVVDSLQAQFEYIPMGAIKVRLNAKGQGLPNVEEKSWSFILYNTAWSIFKGKGTSTGSSVESQEAVFTDIPVGTYYVGAGASISGTGFPGGLPHDAWLFEYYNDSPDQGGASSVQVNASDTTRITMELDQTTYITIATNPNKEFQFAVDGSNYTAPKQFGWRKSDVHTIGVNEYYDLPSENNIRCYFREWRHGGSRVQSYTVPSPKFRQNVDTLVARFDYKCKLDVLSKYGNPKPKASDWYPAWQNVTVSVENSVIQYSDGAFAFRKASAGKDSVRHLFDRWTGAGYGSYSGKNNPATFLLNANTVETALWKDQFPLVAQPNDTLMGTVSANPKGVWQNRDTTVVLTAVPKKGYGFVKWEGSKTDTTKILSVKMDTSKTLTAKFAPSTAVGEKPATGLNPGDPLSFELYQNYPNPFNPSTKIRFDVPEPGKVTIEIFMLMGKRLKVLAETEYAPGSYRVTWDGTDAHGQKVGSGIYICRMGAGSNVKFIKLSLIK